MSTYFLAAPRSSPPVTPAPALVPRPKLILESLDGRRRIPLDGSTGWSRLDGSTGLEMPPVEVITGQSPGVPGSTLQEVRVEERPVFVPIEVRSAAGHVPYLEMLDQLRSLVDPLTGEFRLVGLTARSERELTVVYVDGLQGQDGRTDEGLYWRRFGLKMLACEPFARDRRDRVVEFKTPGGTRPFLGVVGGTDAPWPGSLSSSAVIGSNMRVPVFSEALVHPIVELVGPMESFAGTLALEDATLPPFYGGSEWSVNIPTGVPAGMALRMVTDPRARSTRLGAGDPLTTPGWVGERAPSRVALGSTLSPFYPGVNVMSVSAPGGTDATRVRIRWRELRRSLW